LRSAFAAAATELEAIAAETARRAGADVGAIFEAQALFARDPGLVGPALAAIADGSSAVDAIERVAAEQADSLGAVDDEYFRERAADIRDVARRVVGQLIGRPSPELHHRDGSIAILAASDLDASIVAVLRPELVAGIALSGGAANGHASIVARALGIPVVLGLGAGLEQARDGATALLDGDAGRLVIDPDPADIAEVNRAAETGGQAPLMTQARGRLAVRVEANVASLREAEQAAAAGADGIGLVRTELLFLGRSVPPGLAEQRDLYRRIGRAMGQRPVAFRTLDVGGDKQVPYLDAERESNPALGVRGVRLSLRRADLFETQLAALLEASAGRSLRVMFPMVATREELDAAREMLDTVAARLSAAGVAIASEIEVGVMIEVPAAAVMSSALADAVDFFSIGTNDLVQYTLAADRTNPALAELASPLQPAILRLVASVVAAARPAGVSVAVCGEAAADPLAIPLLVGLGVDELSVAPNSIGRVRDAVAALDIDAARRLAEAALSASTLAEVQAIVAPVKT
jgi:phosphoenolpyruvate-protein phosphotransferase